MTMELLESLNFVKGGISATKSLSPVLSNYRVKYGQIFGFNGTICLSCPISLELDVAPNAKLFHKAIAAAGDNEIAISQKGDDILVRFNRTSIKVPCTLDDFPQLDMSGSSIKLPEDFIHRLELIAPFMGNDVTRPWACGVLFKQGYCYATNNVSIVRTPVYDVPEFVLPSVAVNELLRLKKNTIQSVTVNNTHAIFFFGDKSFMWTKLVAAEWPDVEKLYSHEAKYDRFVPDDLAAMVELQPFTAQNTLWIAENSISTSLDGSTGAQATLTKQYCSIVKGFNVKALLTLSDITYACDFGDSQRDPIRFIGDDVEAVLAAKIPGGIE